MNIEKLAKHLKEFTLDEIEMIAEVNCKTELEQLLNRGEIIFESGKYKYVEKFLQKTFQLCAKPILRKECILFEELAQDYLANRTLSKDTLKGYRALLKYNLIPAFGKFKVSKITYEMIVEFMQEMKNKYRPKTASNAVTLLGSILKYGFEKGYIKHNPYYGVKNSMCK